MGLLSYAASQPRWRPSRPRLNFITIHYLYIIGWVIVGSILLYPIRNMPYVDALFFASGASTQSGLNTIDLNLLDTYQQAVLYFIPWFCNPIFIHSAVVFIRLYWFEKRFDRIVADVRKRRWKRTDTDGRTIDPESDGIDATATRHSRWLRHHHAKHEAPIGGPPTKEELDAACINVSNEERVRQEKEDEKRRKKSKVDGHDGSDGASIDSNPFMESDTEDAVQRPAKSNCLSRAQSGRSPDTPSGIQFGDLPVPPRGGEQHPQLGRYAAKSVEEGTWRIPSPREFDDGMRPELIDNHLHPSHVHPMHHAITTGDIPSEDEKSDSMTARKSRRAQTGLDAHHTGPSRLPRRLSNLDELPKAKSFDKAIQNLRRRGRSNSMSSVRTAKSTMPYLSYEATVGRNSTFVDLTDEQRDELGGIEYRSLKVLAYILVGYYLFFHLFGMVCIGPWIAHTAKYKAMLAQVAVGSRWWALFTASSAFTDLGFTLTPDSMISFQKATWPVLVLSFLIIIGNTGFPCMLRFVIWVGSKIVPDTSPHWQSLRFLLDHPRRCFTLLFPSTATWWLFWVLVVLNGLDMILFIILDLHDETVVGLPVSYRLLAGFFQAASTRTAGFCIVNLADLHAAVQVSYMVMMYISVMPIAISMRRTNVYEERSLGIYANQEENDADSKEPSFVGAHLRRQLSFDLWYIFLGLFVICIAEGSKIDNRNDWAFTTFSVLFEVVSAYGTVGLSLGYPNSNASFSAQFTVVSKLVIIAMQIRGRHRGLPYELDRAILLPSDSLQRKEAADANRRAARRLSQAVSERPPGFAITSRSATQNRTQPQTEENEPTPNINIFQTVDHKLGQTIREVTGQAEPNGDIPLASFSNGHSHRPGLNGRLKSA